MKRSVFGDVGFYSVDVFSASYEEVQERDLSCPRSCVDASPSIAKRIVKDLTRPVFIQRRLDKIDVAVLATIIEFPLIQFLQKGKPKCAEDVQSGAQSGGCQ